MNTFDEDLYTPPSKEALEAFALDIDDLFYDVQEDMDENPSGSALSFDDFDIDLGEFALGEDAGLGLSSERRLSMAFSRRLSLRGGTTTTPDSSIIDAEENKDNSNLCCNEPSCKRLRTCKDLPSQLIPPSNEMDSFHIGVANNLKTLPKIDSCADQFSSSSNNGSTELLSLMSPQDLRLHLEQTQSRLEDSMKRSAISRQQVDNEAAKLAGQRQKQHKQPWSTSSSSAVPFSIQISMQKASSFFTSHINVPYSSF